MVRSSNSLNNFDTSSAPACIPKLLLALAKLSNVLMDIYTLIYCFASVDETTGCLSV